MYLTKLLATQRVNPGNNAGLKKMKEHIILQKFLCTVMKFAKLMLSTMADYFYVQILYR